MSGKATQCWESKHQSHRAIYLLLSVIHGKAGLPYFQILPLRYLQSWRLLKFQSLEVRLSIHL